MTTDERLRTAEVLFVLSEFPGVFTEAVAALAGRLEKEGLRSAFVVASRYYERFSGVDLEARGPVIDVATEVLGIDAQDPSLEDEPLDLWHTHATFVRMRRLLGRHENAWLDYARAARVVRTTMEAAPRLQVVISEPPSNSLVALAHAESGRRGLPFVGLACGRVAGHFNVAMDALGSKMLKNPDAPPTLPVGPPPYSASPASNLSTAQWSFLAEGLVGQVRRGLRAGGSRSLELGRPLEVQVKSRIALGTRKLKHALGTRLAGWFDECPDVDPSHVNLSFPLHVRPEASTSVQARYYEDDLQTVRNIAFSLPPRGRLFVREHPAGIGTRSATFYREIRALPRTYLQGPDRPFKADFPSYDAMVCLTGTAGFEALQHGMPVFLLGHCFYETYPGVTRIDSWDDLYRAVRATRKRTSHADLHDARRRYAEVCFPGDFNYGERDMLDPANLERLLVPVRLVLGGYRDVV